MRKTGIFQLLADEALRGGVDIVAGDLVKLQLRTQLHQSVDLGIRVSGRHKGYGVDPALFQVREQLVQIIIFKFGCFLVSGGGSSHITQISIAEDRIDIAGELDSFFQRHQFFRGRHINVLDQFCF